MAQGFRVYHDWLSRGQLFKMHLANELWNFIKEINITTAHLKTKTHQLRETK